LHLADRKQHDAKAKYPCSHTRMFLYYYGVLTLAALRHRPNACVAISPLLLSIIPAVTLFHTSLIV
jgi:hypothetical protein